MGIAQSIARHALGHAEARGAGRIGAGHQRRLVAEQARFFRHHVVLGRGIGHEHAKNQRHGRGTREQAERQQRRLGRGKWPAFAWAALTALRLPWTEPAPPTHHYTMPRMTSGSLLNSFMLSPYVMRG